VWNDYRFQFEGGQENFQIVYQSAVRDLTLKSDFDYYPAPAHHIKFGVNLTRHRFNPQTTSGKSAGQSF
jgi:hypothetical protein